MIPPSTPVSTRSVFADNTWDFSAELAARPVGNPTALSFAMTLSDGSCLLDKQNAALLEDAKRLCFFLLREDPCRPRSPSTIIQLRGRLKWLFGELVRRGHRSLAPFCLDVAEDIVSATIRRCGDADACLQLFAQLWRYRDILQHPPLCPPAPALIERWLRHAARRRNPTQSLEPEEALMLGGFALNVVRRASAALDELRRPTPGRLQKALRGLVPALELGDVLTAVYVVVLLDACLRPLELVTLPTDCVVRRDTDGSTPLFALQGVRWKKRDALSGSPASWPASRNVVFAISVLRDLARLHKHSGLAFVVRMGRIRPATSQDVYNEVRAFANRWDLRSVTGDRLRISPRRLRATGSMLLVRYAQADGPTLSRQLQHAPRSWVTESHYGQLAAGDLAHLAEAAPVPFHVKYGMRESGA
jgi:hypothetical protein